MAILTELFPLRTSFYFNKLSSPKILLALIFLSSSFILINHHSLKQSNYCQFPFYHRDLQCVFVCLSLSRPDFLIKAASRKATSPEFTNAPTRFPLHSTLFLFPFCPCRLFIHSFVTVKLCVSVRFCLLDSFERPVSVTLLC